MIWATCYCLFLVTLTEANIVLCSLPAYRRNSWSPLPIQAASSEPFFRWPANSFSGLPLTETYTSPREPSPVSQVTVVVPNFVGPAGTGLGEAVMLGAEGAVAGGVVLLCEQPAQISRTARQAT